MVREYRWSLRVRSYEGDSHAQVSAAGILRYLEQSAIDAAADAGYGRAFHLKNRSAWVIRRMTLLLGGRPARIGDDLQIRTWITHFAKVRGGREYRVANAATGDLVATGLAEWVYLNRDTFTPMLIPADLGAHLDMPGAPLGTYEAPTIDAIEDGPKFAMARLARWHETDSMQHINNAVYADWLDEAMRDAIAQMGWSMASLREKGLQLRGEYYYLDYKKAAVPEDNIVIATQFKGISATQCAVEQSVVTKEGIELLRAKSAYCWRSNAGEDADGPEGWTQQIMGYK